MVSHVHVGRSFAPDRRVLSSEQRLRAAYVELLDSIGSEEITPTVLTSSAGVSRATFYRHHRSIVAYRQELCDAVLDQMREAFSRARAGGGAAFGTYEALSGRLQALTSVIEADFAVHRVLWGSSGPRGFRDRIRELIAALIAEDIDRLSVTLDRSYSPPEYVVAFEAGATVGVLQAWILKDAPEPADDIALCIMALVQNGAEVMKPGSR